MEKEKGKKEFYKKLNTNGEATKTLLKIIPLKHLEVGFNTYCVLNHLLSTLPIIPFPYHITKPIWNALDSLQRHGYLSKEETEEIITKLEKNIKRNIKRYLSQSKKERLRYLPIIRRRDPLYRYCYPESIIAENDNVPLDFLIYFLAKHCDKRFKLHKAGYDKWGLIADFLNEQGIPIEADTAKKRYQRSNRNIPIVYSFIYLHYPHGHFPYPRLLEWERITTEALRN